MKNTILLINAKIRGITNGFRFATRADLLKFSFVFLAACAVMFGLYLLFYKVLASMREVPLMGPILTVKLISMIFLTFYLMLIYSNVITSFSTIYFSSDLPFLLAAPVPPGAVFTLKFLETATYSSWSTLLTFLPFLFAYGRVHSVNVLCYLLVIIGLLPFLVLAAATGIFFSLLLMSLFPTKKTRDVSLIFGVLIGGGLYMLVRILQPEKIVNPEAMVTVVNYLAMLRAPSSPLLPNFWLTRILTSAASWNFGMYGIALFVLTAAASVLFFMVLVAAHGTYYRGWAQAQESSGGYVPRFSRKTFGVFSRSPRQAIFEKDFKLFVRDTSQWSQLFLVMALVFVYLFNIYKLPLDTYHLKVLISFLNIGMAGFVLAALALRFVFPAVSLEGNAFWVIRSSPVSERDLLRVKFLMALAPMLVTGVVLILLSNIILGVDAFFMGLSLVTVMVMTAGLVSMGIGMGAMYPRFNIENIAQIESSRGGIMYMLFSLGYVSLIIVLEAGLVVMYLQHKLGYSRAFYWPLVVLAGIGFVAVNVLALVMPLRIGRKNLAKLPF